MLDFVFEPAFWASLVLLIGLEVVLSADNAVFISSAAAKLPEGHRKRILQIGMVLATVFRLILLAGILWVLGLQRVAFTIGGWSPSWRELILLGGGLFLVYKAVSELSVLVERSGVRPEEAPMKISDNATIAVVQIAAINAVFSADSIITAVGLTGYVQAMAIAVVASAAILYFAASEIGEVIERHPSIKATALGFLLVAGTGLVAEGFGFAVPRTYLYPALGFGVLVLAVTQLVYRKSDRLDVVLPTAQAMNVPERAEPVLDPLPSDNETPVEPTIAVEPIIEPIIVPEPEVGIEEEIEEEDRNEVLVAEEPALQADDPEIPAPEDQIAIDEVVLGEERDAMPKSRRKRPMPRRRPERLRTARRKE